MQCGDEFLDLSLRLMRRLRKIETRLTNVSNTFDRDSKEFLSVSHDLGTHEHDQEEVVGFK